jgi:RHS repeat-associated protein
MYDGVPTTMTTAAICASRELAWSPSFYRGEQYDSDLGLYYLRARYYNPATGRFMSRDPEDGKAKDPASLHKYLYANGDPVNAADPAGRAAIMQYQILTWRRERVATKVALDIGIKVAACYVALAGTVVADLEHSALGTGIGGAATVIDCGILAVLFF